MLMPYANFTILELFRAILIECGTTIFDTYQ